MLTFGIAGSHVLITGANRGIGRTIAETFLAEGANVSYCSRSTTGTEFDAFISAKYPRGDGPQAIGTAVDVGDTLQVENWVTAAASRFGRIDTIVANVSVAEIRSDSMAAWRNSVEVDLFGVIAFCSAAQKHLISTASLKTGTKPSPSIIIISTVAATSSALGGPSPYGPLKAAQNRYAMSLAKDLGPQGVRVNLVAPGTVDTPSLNQVFESPGGEGIRDAVISQIPLGRLGQTQDIANSVAFMASGLAAWVNGATLYVDGGLTRYS